MTFAIQCGDAYELMKGVRDKSIDLIVTDPPYQLDIDGGGIMGDFKTSRQTFSQLWRHNGPLLQGFDFDRFMAECERVMKKFNGYFWTNKIYLPKYLNFAEAKGYAFDILIWQKMNPIPAFNNKYMTDREFCVFIKESGAPFHATYHTSKTIFRTRIGGVEGKNAHPCQKPLELLRPLILNSSDAGDMVLDPFMGSGTTGIVCMELGRKFVGYEIEPDFFEMAKRRIQAAAQQERL